MDRKSARHGAAHSAPDRRTRPKSPRSPDPGSALTPVIDWVRGHLVPVAVLSVLAVAAVVAGVVFLAAGGAGKTTSGSGHSMGTAAAQAATTVTKGSKWLGGSGARQLTLVNADVARVMTAERAGSRGSAAKAAGARLAADAAAALSGTMPPVDAAAYRAALQRLEAAGSAAAKGQYGPKVAHLVNAGEAGLMKVTAAADAPVPQKTAAIPEPNGQ
jgi:hypothetical protein